MPGVMVMGRLLKMDGTPATKNHNVKLDGAADYTAVAVGGTGSFTFTNVANGVYNNLYQDPDTGTWYTATPATTTVTGAPVAKDWKGDHVR